MYQCQDCLEEFEVPLVRGGGACDPGVQATQYYVCPNCECDMIIELLNEETL